MAAQVSGGEVRLVGARVAPDDAGNAPQVGQPPLRGGSTVTKKDDVARSEKIEADRTQEIWDDDGGRAPRPDENGAAESSPQPASPPSRRVDRKSTRLNSSHLVISYA